MIKPAGQQSQQGGDFESLAGKAQGTTSILNDLDITPAKNNIGSIQQAVDGVDFDKLSRNSESAIKNMSTVWNTNKTPIRDTIKDALVDNIKFDDVLKEKYSGYAVFSVKGYNDKIKELKSETKATMQNFAEKGAMNPFANKLGIHSPSTVFSGYGGNIVSGLKSGINSYWSSFSTLWKEKIFSISDAFSNIRNEMKIIGENIIGGIIDGLQSVWNNLASWVGSIKDALTFNISTPFSGSYSYSPNSPMPYTEALNIPNVPIPHLAQGMVVPPNKEFLAMLGDNKRETEVVSPLSTIEQAVKNAMSQMGGGQKEIVIKVPIYLDGKQITEVVVKHGKLQQASTGNNIFALG